MGVCRSVSIIVSPYHAGLKDHRVGRGPHAILDAGLVEKIKERLPEDVDLKVMEIDRVKWVPKEIEGDIGRSFAVLRLIAEAVRKAREGQSWPLVLSGNCMDIVGVSAGLNQVTKQANPERGVGENASNAESEVIWFDAHADLETTETTGSGYLDGMAASMLIGEGFGNLLSRIPGYRRLDEKQLVGVGFRDVSPAEMRKIQDKGIRVIWGSKQLGRREYTNELERLLTQPEGVAQGRKETVLHLDVDALDPSVGRANEFAVEGDLGERDLIECMDVIGQRRRLKAMHVASLNPEFEGWENVVDVTVKAIVKIIGSYWDVIATPAVESTPQL